MAEIAEDKNYVSHLFSSPTSDQRREKQGAGLSLIEASRIILFLIKLIRNTVGHLLSATTLGPLGSNIRKQMISHFSGLNNSNIGWPPAATKNPHTVGCTSSREKHVKHLGGQNIHLEPFP